MEIKDVENLAELAKIELNEEEKQRILTDVEGILGYVKIIESVDVPEMDIQYEHKNSWREDKIEVKDFSREEILSQFPDSQDGFVKVKKIL
jgi:aspartyl-tRNA(Asn)/glutamyl-tRNA(Gln) amidotransferase subunit C